MFVIVVKCLGLLYHRLNGTFHLFIYFFHDLATFYNFIIITVALDTITRHTP